MGGDLCAEDCPTSGCGAKAYFQSNYKLYYNFLLALEIGLISQEHDGLAQDVSLE